MMIGWEIMYGIGALILLGAIIYGVTQSRLKSRRAEDISETAVKREYEHPEEYKDEQAAFENAAETAETDAERAEKRQAKA